LTVGTVGRRRFRQSKYAALALFCGILNVIALIGGIFVRLGAIAAFLLRLAGDIAGVSVRTNIVTLRRLCWRMSLSANRSHFAGTCANAVGHAANKHESGRMIVSFLTFQIASSQ
jgi:hypothetical protein